MMFTTKDIEEGLLELAAEPGRIMESLMNYLATFNKIGVLRSAEAQDLHPDCPYAEEVWSLLPFTILLFVAFWSLIIYRGFTYIRKTWRLATETQREWPRKVVEGGDSEDNLTGDNIYDDINDQLPPDPMTAEHTPDYMTSAMSDDTNYFQVNQQDYVY